MASKTVSQLKIKLGLENSQVFDKLRGSFRQLEKTVGVTDKGIEQLRDGLKQYGAETTKSTAFIKGQIDAFKGLQNQATIGGKAYRKLGSDIKALTKELRSLELQYNEVEVASKRSNKQLLLQTPSRETAKFAEQMRALRETLAVTNVTSNDYTQTLAEQEVRQTALTRVLERQLVIANALERVKISRSETTREGFIEFYSQNLAALPNTTAALSQRLKELRQDLANLSIGGDKYINTLQEINRVQAQLAAAGDIVPDPYGTNARKQQIRERLGQQPVFGMFEQQDPIQKAILRNRRKREREARRARQVPTQVSEISGLYQQITDIGMARTRGYIDAMGNSYRRVASDIREATAASNGSINSLNSQRAAWTTLRNGLNPASEAYREVSREIDKVDKKLRRLNRGSMKGRIGRNIAAGAGGMLSGGIFGGPEGAVGGLVGGLFAGPGGALAGAAAGAQISQLRQQLGGVAEFNAEITLAKTTLAQASTGLEDYNRLIGLARKVSSDYAISLKPAISGLAQIATAARANNLSFEDTEKIYRGIIASNVAFGKSQEDLDAIVRATVQVLSKGKVSAEELSGQIGERLPGAVAKFAAANNMTLPQLTKAFKDGEVTIAQFVKFTAAQGEEYDAIAQKIAEGPEKAGLRLQIALENSGEIFGSFFAKAGAGFQDFFTQIVTFFNNNEKRVKLFVTNMVNGAVIVAGTIKNIVMGIVNFAKGALDILEKFNPLIKAVRLSFQKGLEDFYDKAPDRMKGIADKFGIQLYTVEQLFPNQTPKSFGKGGGVTGGGADGADTGADKKGKSDLERRLAAAREMFRRLKDSLEVSKQQRPLDVFLAKQAKVRSDFEARFKKLRKDGKNETIEQLYKESEILLTKKERADLEKFLFDKLRGIGTQLDQNITKEKKLTRELVERRYQLGLAEKDEYVSSQLASYEEDLRSQGYSEDRIAEAMEVRRQELDPTPFEQMRQNIAQLKKELADLVNPVNQITGAANAIGTAFSNSFINVINGSQTAREALASFFQNIANYFLDMAAQIIAKMIQMAILNSIVGLLPGAGAAPMSSKGYFDPISGKGIAGPNFGLANGGIIDSGTVKRYAMGGIVDKPTMFAYANGGTGRFGLMGEAGPEAIMPLKRGPGGKLGVQASGGVGNIVVNVDAQGTQVQGDQPNANKLGEALGAAVRAELIRQKRPGGLLA